MRENRGNIMVLDGGHGVCRRKCCFQNVRTQIPGGVLEESSEGFQCGCILRKILMLAERRKQHTIEKLLFCLFILFLGHVIGISNTELVRPGARTPRQHCVFRLGGGCFGRRAGTFLKCLGMVDGKN